jgi:hypothetical protein
MTPFGYGAFVTWKLFPAVKVSLDGRFEVAYPPGAVRESLEFYAARPGWREVLTKYATDAVLVARSEPLSEAMREWGQWPLVYEDDAYLIYARPGVALPFSDHRRTRLAGEFP